MVEGRAREVLGATILLLARDISAEAAAAGPETMGASASAGVADAAAAVAAQSLAEAGAGGAAEGSGLAAAKAAAMSLGLRAGGGAAVGSLAGASLLELAIPKRYLGHVIGKVPTTSCSWWCAVVASFPRALAVAVVFACGCFRLAVVLTCVYFALGDQARSVAPTRRQAPSLTHDPTVSALATAPQAGKNINAARAATGCSLQVDDSRGPAVGPSGEPVAIMAVAGPSQQSVFHAACQLVRTAVLLGTNTSLLRMCVLLSNCVPCTSVSVHPPYFPFSDEQSRHGKSRGRRGASHGLYGRGKRRGKLCHNRATFFQFLPALVNAHRRVSGLRSVFALIYVYLKFIFVVSSSPGGAPHRQAGCAHQPHPPGQQLQGSGFFFALPF